MKQKVEIIIGTRPELIKFAPIITALQSNQNTFSTIVCFTGQHREMLSQTAHAFGVHPDIDLDLMQPGQTLTQLTSRAVQAIGSVLEQSKPDIVLVQGDTTTAFCGALAAYYQHIKIGHIEAGLRTYDKYAPFPEEINRRLIGQLADYHFAPTENAKNALLKENISEQSIFVTGNTVIDALLWMRAKLITQNYTPNLPADLLRDIKNKRVILVTGHRRESFGEGFEQICHAILEVAKAYPNVAFVYPVHLNPQVQQPVTSILAGQANIWLLNPLDYPDLVWLMDKSYLVLTDSGGIQEEAPALGKPVLVMRETTERPEGIQAGNARLVGTSKNKIVNNLIELLDNPLVYHTMSQAHNPYGDGKAAERIEKIILTL